LLRPFNAFVYVLLALILIDMALSEDYTDTQTISGMMFNAHQSVSGLGMVSSYRCLQSDPSIIKSLSGGNGFYSSDLIFSGKKNVDVSKKTEDYISSGTEYNFKDNESSAYLPITLSPIGSFSTCPVKYKWYDVTLAGNNGGLALKTTFSDANSLVKEMSTTVSGAKKVSEFEESSGSFKASMSLNSAFNGTAQISMMDKVEGRAVPINVMDEYYRGSFSLTKKMTASFKSSTTTEVDDKWLPCCSGGFIDIPSPDREYLSSDCVFNCSVA
jgi:hypothetical protein